MNQTVLESVHRILEGHKTPPLPPGPQRCSCAVLQYPKGRGYSHETSLNGGEVECHFNVSSEGDIEDLAVMCDVGNITKYLPPSAIEALESECFDGYMVECKDRNDDYRIDRYISAMEAA